ncbi:MAG: ATP-dependent zinc metalloprotease FtsH [Eubacteriales bacterium]
MKGNFKTIIFYIVLIASILIASTLLLEGMQTEDVQYSDIIKYFQNEQVAKFNVDVSNKLTIQLKDSDKVIEYKLRSQDLFDEYIGPLILQQLADGTLQQFDFKSPATIPWWISILPYVIAIILFIVLWIYVMNQATGKGGKISSFGKAKAKLGNEEKKKVFFADVAGCEEEKEELREVVDFLRNPLKFMELGARIPRGVLLVGPPGTGKTLLAKAVAGEAGVPFYSISGSDFVEMYVGVGASRVRDLFDTAKKNPASIIFIDEIDAVGRHRGAGLGGGHDEREQTLNQLLVEMDGFGNNEGVIVIAATNRHDILDPALLRPGRFDRQVIVNYPDIKGRVDILKVHSRGKPLEKDVDFEVVAKTTVGFTGADLANLLNEAALLAARKQKKLIGMNEIEEAMIKIIVGPAKKNKVVSEKERRLTAFHEAGHAITTKLLKSQDPVHQISIIPSGRAGGYTLSLPLEDKNYSSKLEMQDEIVTLLGGRVAEMLVMHDISTGASNDIQRVSALARKMVTQYGMSDKLGPIVFGTGHEEVFLGREISSSRNYSEQIAFEIDEEVKHIVDEAYAKAKEILSAHMDKLTFVAEFLIKNEIMDGTQFERAMQEDGVTFQQLEDMLSEKRKRSEEENRLAREIAEKRQREENLRREEMLKKENEERLRKQRGQNNNPPPDDISFKDGDKL